MRADVVDDPAHLLHGDRPQSPVRPPWPNDRPPHFHVAKPAKHSPIIHEAHKKDDDDSSDTEPEPTDASEMERELVQLLKHKFDTDTD